MFSVTGGHGGCKEQSQLGADSTDFIYEPTTTWASTFISLTFAFLIYHLYFNILEKDMTTHSTILSGESRGQRQLVGYSPWGWRFRHDWVTNANTFTFFYFTSYVIRGWVILTLIRVGVKVTPSLPVLTLCLHIPCLWMDFITPSLGTHGITVWQAWKNKWGGRRGLCGRPNNGPERPYTLSRDRLLLGPLDPECAAFYGTLQVSLS